MTQDEILKKIGEYLDIFQPEEQDTLADFAAFLGIEASTVKWSVAISTLGFGNAFYEGVIDSLRNADPTYSNYTNGGKIVELNHSIYRSLINILGGDKSITNYEVFFTQIQNYIDDVFIPIGCYSVSILCGFRCINYSRKYKKILLCFELCY